MIKIALVPIMARILSKLDIKPVITKLKSIDIFEKGQQKVSNEEMGIIAFEILTDITPQLDKIGADIPEFVAAYKGVSIAEANELDFADIINEIISDEGILTFFKRALRKKVERTQ